MASRLKVRIRLSMLLELPKGDGTANATLMLLQHN
jgi:hypothetical protein